MKQYEFYEDFQKPSIKFEDVMPVMKNPNTLREIIDMMTEQYRFDNVDYFVGLESRGFFLASPVAYQLGAGFIAVRKAGKLPGETHKVTYKKEYGEDSFEIKKYDEIGAKVVIVDDLIATGGSLKAAYDLCVMSKFNIVGCCVLRELKDLVPEDYGIKYKVLFP